VTTSVGVDVGGTNIKAVVCDVGGRVLDRAEIPTPPRIEQILEAVAELSRRLGAERPLGLAMAGLVDHRAGVLRWAPHLPGVEVEVRELLTRRLGIPVTVENDANAAAVAEQRRGAGRGAQSLAMLTLGTGIGLGLIDDGRLIRGRAHAGEIGHVTVEPGGLPCPCGRSGCWETRVSGRALDEAARRIVRDSASAVDLVEAARAGDGPASQAVANAALWLAVGIEALALVFDPEVIVVGGAAAEAGDLLLGPARKRLQVTEGAAHRVPIRVEASILGRDAGAVGAAILAAEETGT